MKQLTFSTGNSTKFLMGSSVCKEYGIELTQNTLDVDEVQSEDALYVAKRKAESAYTLLKQPVVISDDSWEIIALRGFPGTYAKSVNTWFNADDYIRLMDGIKDRSVLLKQVLVYRDADTQKVFSFATHGILLPKKRGTAKPTATIMEVVSLDSKTGLSIAEELEKGALYSEESTLHVWHDFAQWYAAEIS